MARQFSSLIAKLDKLKGTALRLSMRLPTTSHLALAKSLGFDHERYPELDPHMQLLVAARKWLSADGAINPPPEISRYNFRRDMAAIAKPSPVGSVKDWQIPSQSGNLTVRHYTPKLQGAAQKNKQPLPLLVFFHGGSFMVGDIDTHDEPCRLLCQHGQMQVLSVTYRLTPEHPAPAAIDDCLDTLKWAYHHAASLGADPKKIAVGGDSAGGNITAVISQLTAGTAYAPVAQLLIYPPVDFVNAYPSHDTYGSGLLLSKADMESAKAAYFSQSMLAHSDPKVSPINGNLAGLPPALLITAAFDTLRDEGEIYAARMRDAGTPCIAHRVDGLGHGFINMTTVNLAALKATKQIAYDFRALLDGLD